jgi:hypothetical protein
MGTINKVSTVKTNGVLEMKVDILIYIKVATLIYELRCYNPLSMLEYDTFDFSKETPWVDVYLPHHA